MRTLIVIPTTKECDFFIEGCIKRGFQSAESVTGRLPVAGLVDLDMTVACGGLGKAQFALQTQHLLDAGADWDIVFCAGAAGALADELSIGDVVVATSTVEHDHKNRFTERPRPRFEGAQETISELKRLASVPSFRVHFGAVASGDEDITGAERSSALQESTGALVVAWEGAGGARACAFSQVPFVEVRAVTDTADHDAPSDYDANLEVAMNNLAGFLTSWAASKRP